MNFNNRGETLTLGTGYVCVNIYQLIKQSRMEKQCRKLVVCAAQTSCDEHVQRLRSAAAGVVAFAVTAIIDTDAHLRHRASIGGAHAHQAGSVTTIAGLHTPFAVHVLNHCSLQLSSWSR